MNPKPISLQLYTLRDEAAKDFPAVLRRVAEIGYKGVESAGFYGFTPREFRKMVEDLGMVVSSSWTPAVNLDSIQEVIEAFGELGTNLAVTGYGREQFATLDEIKRTAETVTLLKSQLAEGGITLAIHNHAWEFERIDGRLKQEIFAELCPGVQFELDTYWATNFGENDAADMVRRFAKQCPLLHIKDGPMAPPNMTRDAKTRKLEPAPGANTTLLPVGSGGNDIRGILAAMDPAVTQWLIVEQDNSDTDMFECVEKSYRYLIENGLAAGNR